jgi:CheY-like chemotaxis protein
MIPFSHNGADAGAARRVLIVEDHPDGREALRLLLSLLGHQIEVAADGPEGVRQGLAFRPDLAIIDIGLPTLDGLAVGRLLRAALGPDVVLIAHTAYDDAVVARQVIEAGYDEHLVKPVAIDELLRCLQRGARHAAPPATTRTGASSISAEEEGASAALRQEQPA